MFLQRLDPGLGGYLGDYSMLALLPNYLALLRWLRWPRLFIFQMDKEAEANEAI
jgi:hypothetical protein